MSSFRSGKPSRQTFSQSGHAYLGLQIPPTSIDKLSQESPSSRTRTSQVTPTESYEERPAELRVQELERSLQSAERQLRLRSRELLEVQAATKKTDTYTEAAISEKLEHVQLLNTELSKFVWEWKTLTPRSRYFPTSFKRRRQLGHCINPEFVLYLSSISLENEAVAMPLLQLAWKAIVSRGILLILEPYSLLFHTFSQSGDLDNKSGESNPIVFAAKRMHDAEPESAYANWRFLTHRYMRESLAAHIKSSVEAISASITRLLFASISLPNQPNRPSYKTFLEKCEPSVQGVLKEAVELAKMIQEGVLTREYRPLRYPFGRVLDEKTMNLEDGSTLLAADQLLCVTQPGLIDGQNRVLVRASVMTRSKLHSIAGKSVPSISFPQKAGLRVDRAMQRAVSVLHRTMSDPNLHR